MPVLLVVVAFGVRTAKAVSLTGRKPRLMVALMATMSFSAKDNGLPSAMVTVVSVASLSVVY